jgi:phosphohistidine phosphatase
VRHAKSSWDNAALADIDRPLNKRGRQAAVEVARHIAALRPPPEVVLVSPARRAQETLAPIVEALGDRLEIRVEPVIYEEGPTELLEVLRALPEGIGVAMVVGHNPTLEELALFLASDAGSEAFERLAEKFPTGAVASFQVPTWGQLERGSATLLELWTPR